MQTMRDRLIELINNADIYDSMECKICSESDDYCKCCYANKLADHLLANGVIVPLRCENCEYYIPKAILTDEYDNPLGYDGICDNCDKYTDKDDFCSCAKLKEREG